MVTSAPEQLIRPGDRVDRYVVLAKLGEGGAAVIFRARHRELGTLHALKVLRVMTGTQSERLFQEGRIQATLKHPHIVGVTDVIRVGTFPALVMEHVAGLSLDKLLLQYRPSLDEIDALARDILSGMRAAHEQGLIHRDLKPANVLLELARDKVIAKVSDFGLAKVLDEVPEGRRRSTMSGVMMGTPAYMAPEQLRSARDVDHRADIFALGALLYELASGVPVFHPEDMKDLIALYQALSGGRYRPLDEVAPDTPQRWVQAVHRALSPAPEDRPQTLEELQALWIGDEPPPKPVWEMSLLRGLSGVDEGAHTVENTGTLIPVEPTTVDPGARKKKSLLGSLGLVRAAILVGAVLLVGASLTFLLMASFGTLAWLGGSQPQAVATPEETLPEPSSPGPSPVEPVSVAAEAPAPLPAEELVPAEPAPEPMPIASVSLGQPATASVPVPGPVLSQGGERRPAVLPASRGQGLEETHERPADGPPRPQSLPGTHFEVAGVDNAWLEDKSGNKLRPGQIPPGDYVLYVFFDAARSTRVLSFALSEGERRTVRCDSITRVCK